MIFMLFLSFLKFILLNLNRKVGSTYLDIGQTLENLEIKSRSHTWMCGDVDCRTLTDRL